MIPGMAEKPDSDRDVLTSLPRSRPTRRSAKRDGGTSAGAAKKRPAAKSAPRPKAKAAAGKAGAKPRPRAVPKAKAKVPPAGYATPAPKAGEGGSGPAEVVGTAVQAAGELAQIGITVSRQALKSALGRLPRP